MDRYIYDDMALERTIKDKFGVTLEIDKVIVHKADVSRTANATVFLTKKKQLICYIDATSKLVLSDVMKLVGRMGLKAEQYMPPKGRPNYFDEIGTERFKEVFPGRGHVSATDIAFYRTLAPYNPALVYVSEVKEGVIYQYDADARTSWRPVAKLTYRRIKTS